MKSLFRGVLAVFCACVLLGCTGISQPKIERRVLTEGEFHGLRIGQTKAEVAATLRRQGDKDVGVSAFFWKGDRAKTDDLEKLEKFDEWGPTGGPGYNMTLFFSDGRLQEIRTEEWKGERIF